MDIIENAKRGNPFHDILIIDCHCHMGHWHNFHVPYGSAEGMLVSMDTLGFNIACVTPHSSNGADYRHGNDMVISALRRYPDRFVGYVTLNPNYPDDMENELKRCFAVPGIKGIKLNYSHHGCAIDYKNYRIAFETANMKKCPILIHTWGENDVEAFGRIAGQYPDARFIMAHAGGEMNAMENAVDVVNKHDNAYVDLALSIVREGNVEWLVREIGPKKVLFGTDMPFFDPRPAFGRVAFARISDEEKIEIFGGNMKRLLT